MFSLEDLLKTLLNTNLLYASHLTVTEEMIEAELRRRKYSEEDIEKVFHKNALRVLREFI